MSGYWMGIGFNSAVNKGGFLSGFGKLLNKFNPTTWFKKAETVSTSIPGGGIGGASSAGRGIGTFADSLKARLRSYCSCCSNGWIYRSAWIDDTISRCIRCCRNCRSYRVTCFRCCIFRNRFWNKISCRWFI